MKFVTFGDSWPWGSELQEWQHPFGHWIAKELNYKFENRAWEAVLGGNYTSKCIGSKGAKNTKSSFDPY